MTTHSKIKYNARIVISRPKAEWSRNIDVFSLHLMYHY